MQVSVFSKQLCVLVGGAAVVWLSWKRSAKGKRPPMARSWIPFVGTAVEYGSNCRKFLASNRAKHGNLFSANFLGQTMHFLHDLECAHSTVMQKPKLFDHQHLFFMVAKQVFKLGFAAECHGIFVRWTHSFFTGSRLRSTAAKFGPLVKRSLQKTTNAAMEHDVRVLTESLMWSTTIRVLHGSYDEKLETLWAKFEEWHACFYQFYAGVPDFMLWRQRQMQEEISSYLSRSIQDEEFSEPMTALKKELVESGHGDEVGRVLFTMVFASFANTAPSTTWSLLFLLRDPAAMAEVKQEIEEVLAKEEGWTQQSATSMPHLLPSSVSKMTKLYAWIQDCVRVQSSMTPARTVTEDTTLTLSDGTEYDLRKGEVLLTCNQHYDERYFANPETPRIDRFHRAQPIVGSDGKALKNAVMSFGMGSSQCPGRHFAYLQMATTISAILVGCEIELVHPELPAPPPDFSRCGHGCMPIDPQCEGSECLRVRVHQRDFLRLDAGSGELGG